MLLLYAVGRPLWHPVVQRLTGGRTTTVVVDSLRDAMAAAFPNLAELSDGAPITLVALKEERRLELWKATGERQVLVNTYPFTGFSGN